MASLGNSNNFAAATWDIGGTGGPFTAALMCRSTLNTGTRRVLIGAGTAANAATWELILDTTNKIGLRWNGSDLVETNTLVVADSWCIIAATKDAGTVAPRYHKVSMAAGVAALHESDSSTIVDPVTVDGLLKIGQRVSSGSQFQGDVWVAGVWREVLTDEDIECLRLDLARWRRTSLKGLWIFDQNPATQRSPDLAGGSAANGSVMVPGTTVGVSSLTPSWSRGVKAGLL